MRRERRHRHRRVKNRDIRTPLAERIASQLSREEASARAAIRDREHDASLILRLFVGEHVHDQQVLRTREECDRHHINTAAFLAWHAIYRTLFNYKEACRSQNASLSRPLTVELSKAQRNGLFARACSARMMRMEHRGNCLSARARQKLEPSKPQTVLTIADRARSKLLRGETARLREETRDVVSH